MFILYKDSILEHSRFECTLHLEWDHKVYSFSNFPYESLAETSGKPNFRSFCERKYKIRGMTGTEKSRNIK